MLFLRYEMVQSKSDPNSRYVVTVADYTPVSCTCPSFYYGIQREGMGPYACKHMLALNSIRKTSKTTSGVTT
jgi:predicted nucleic acid-binding Zn finger protein